MTGTLAPSSGFVAGILESEHHRGADPARPVGGGVRTVVCDEPWRFPLHLQPHERLFLVPRVRVPVPLPYGWWPWTVGCAELHVAASIWPEPLLRWGVWEAEQYFRERVLPLMPRGNRPLWWWQRPSDWTV